RLLEHKWNIKTVLREILVSRSFFSECAYRSKIKSPIDIVIGAAIAFGGKPNTQFLRETASRMGQSLLYPPNVKGWDGEDKWINANTVLLRFNYGMEVATQRNQQFAIRSDLEGWLKEHDIQ